MQISGFTQERKVLLSYILLRKLRVCYLISLRRGWSYNILVEEDQKYDSYRSTALQWGCLWMCFVNLPLSNYTLTPWALQETFWEKKLEVTAFYFLKCSTEAQKIPLKYNLSLYPSPRISTLLWWNWELHWLGNGKQRQQTQS